MKDSYYYKGGTRVPVQVLETARVLRDPGERVSAESAGSPTIPLEDDLVLEIPPELADERSFARDLQGLSQRLLAHEREVQTDRAVAPALRRGTSEAAAFPVVTTPDESGLLFASGDVVAQLPPSKDREWLASLAEPQGWRVTRELGFAPNGYVLSPVGSADPLGFANRLIEEHGALSAHPVFLEEIEERAVLSAGPPAQRGPEVPAGAGLFGRQWHLQEIDAPRAWGITRGAAEIIVAVIDSGVEVGHEVFRAGGKLTEGFNFTNNTPDPRPDTSSHGTSCAAVAGAAWEGGQVLGVAPGCRIMPIRRTQLGNHLKLAESIAWAVDHGADILSCSFGIDGRPWPLPDVVRLALEHATIRGRAGLGCPVFWAAGNGNEAVSTDEWASSDLVIAVAASTDQGRRAPYSDFGSEIDVCAPSSGGTQGIVTAANQGYTAQFGGTSAAAPVVAGAAALVLSVAPNLRWSEMRELLSRSARKIDPAGGNYDERGHSPLYGFGQVDAFRALLAVDVAQEVARAVGAGALAADLEPLCRVLRTSAKGRSILAYLAARRFGLLQALQGSAELRELVARLLPLLADLGGKLRSGQAVSISENTWNEIDPIVQVLKDIEPLENLDENTRNDDLMEEPMNGNVQTFETAVEQLAGLFGIGENGERIVALPPGDAARKRLEEKARIARQELYLRGMPIITREKARELELQLPEIVSLLKGLRRRPALRRQILEQAWQGLQQLQLAHPETELDERLQALGEALGQDVGANGDGERVFPIIAVGVGATMLFASYMIVHTWGR